MKNILVYNWDYVDGHKGGGVSVYMQNMMRGLLSTSDYKLLYLNCGLTYTMDGKLRIVRRQNGISQEIESYEIVNSPVLAPAQQSPRNVQKYLHDESVAELVYTFINEHKIDVVHFNNLEGLPINILKLKDKIKGIKFVYSVHNYFPVCTRVNLWKDEKINCAHNCDKKSFAECAHCYSYVNYNLERIRRFIKKENNVGVYKCCNYLSKVFPDKGDEKLYREFEEITIAYINQYVDLVLAVSQRVKEIIVAHNVREEIVKVSYIGTSVANDQMHNPNVDYSKGDVFRIMYMGYMRKDKGFFFLCEALDKMPPELASRVEVNIVARFNPNSDEVAVLEKLRCKFYGINLVNGYTKDNQKALLQGIHLGIVPVLWEDNLPQVAIEQIAWGVPILVSDFGGAKELCNNEAFIFRTGDVMDFLEKFSAIFNDSQKLSEFYKHSIPLVTMKQHIQELQCFYD